MSRNLFPPTGGSPVFTVLALPAFLVALAFALAPVWASTPAGNASSPAAQGSTPACPPPSTGEEGAFVPTSSVVLAPGVHNFTTINIPAGVEVRTTGNGTLDLRATGDVQVDGVINLSGGNGGTSGSGQIGCGGGATGYPTAGACTGSSSGGVGGPGGTGSPGQSSSGASGGDGGVYGGGGGGAGGGGGGGYSGGGGAGGPSSLGGTGGGTGGPGGNCFSCGGAGGVGGGAPYNGGPGANSPNGAGGGGGSIGSTAAADLAMATTFQPGSGGGGGGGRNATPAPVHGGGGGGGGGALRITGATQIIVSGSLLASGGNGGSDNGGGGGGSGGAIFLAAPGISFSSGASVQARGGVSGAGGNGGVGGNGGLGRILLSANALNTGGAGFYPPLPPGDNGPGYTYVTSYCLNTPTPTGTSTSTPTGTATNTATATPTQVSTIVGHVNWQGWPPQPNIGQQLPITLTLDLGNTEVNYPLALTDPSGFFTVTTTLPSGTYGWRAKGPMFLANSGEFALAQGQVNQVEMGLMRTGDLNGDNVVNISDFSFLKGNFGLGGSGPLEPDTGP